MKKILSVIGLALAGALTLSSPCSATTPTPPVAHRGGTEKYVENTRKAWNDSMANGARWVETDVQFTQDDVPVIMHDDTVDRTTNGTGAVSSLSLSQLRALRTDDGQYVPTLYEFLTDVKSHGAKAFVELKTDPTAVEWTRFNSRVNWTDTQTSIVVTSFDAGVVSTAKGQGYTVGWIDGLGDRSVEAVKATGAVYYLKHQWSITADRLSKWQSGGLLVFPWTVNYEPDWPRFKAYGLPGVLTDKPNAY